MGELIFEGMYFDVVKYGAFPNETYTIQQKNGVRIGSSNSEDRAVDNAKRMDVEKTAHIYANAPLQSIGGSEPK